jgi:histidinol-phosphate/aromatic aminotransferase/cobyric acid decarboxylase-like protein
VKVAVVGSRDVSKSVLERVAAFVSSLPPGTVIISGGARGVDQAAIEAARRAGLPVVVYEPDYATHGKAAPLVRNLYIVAECDELVAFWDASSNGTMHAIRTAVASGKKVTAWGTV